VHDVYYNLSQDGGATFGGGGFQVDRAPAGARSEYPDIAATGSTVYAVYEDSRNGLDDVYLNFSTDNGVTWQMADIRLNTDAAGGSVASSPRIAVSGTEAHVVWEDSRSGHLDVRYNRTLDTGATWLPFDLRLDTGDTPGRFDSNSPRVALSGNRVHAVWHDERNAVGGDGDIYFNISAGVEPYGVGLPGTGGLTPLIAISGNTQVGGAFSVDVSNGRGGAAGFLLIGSIGNKVAIPVAGGTLLVLPYPTPPVPIMLGGTAGVAGAGSVSIPLMIPAYAGLAGLPLYFQAMVVDPGAVFGFAFTAGVSVFIG
jgi:hypothetical protein